MKDVVTALSRHAVDNKVDTLCALTSDATASLGGALNAAQRDSRAQAQQLSSSTEKALRFTDNVAARLKEEECEDALSKMMEVKGSCVEALITALVTSIKHRFTAAGGAITEARARQQRLFDAQKRDKQLFQQRPTSKGKKKERHAHKSTKELMELMRHFFTNSASADRPPPATSVKAATPEATAQPHPAEATPTPRASADEPANAYATPPNRRRGRGRRTIPPAAATPTVATETPASPSTTHVTEEYAAEEKSKSGSCLEDVTLGLSPLSLPRRTSKKKHRTAKFAGTAEPKWFSADDPRTRRSPLTAKRDPSVFINQILPTLVPNPPEPNIRGYGCYCEYRNQLVRQPRLFFCDVPMVNIAERATEHYRRSVNWPQRWQMSQPTN